MKIFGREPAALIGLLQALLIMLVSFGWLEALGLDSQDDVMLVVALASGAAAVLLAYATNETLLAPVIETFKAGVALAAIYGLSLSTEQTGSIIAFLTVAIALWQRTQVSPLENGNFRLAA